MDDVNHNHKIPTRIYLFSYFKKSHIKNNKTTQVLHKQQYSALQAQKDVSQMRERSEDEFAHLEHRAQVITLIALLVQMRTSSRTENTVRRRLRTNAGVYLRYSVYLLRVRALRTPCAGACGPTPGGAKRGRRYPVCLRYSLYSLVQKYKY